MQEGVYALSPFCWDAVRMAQVLMIDSVLEGGECAGRVVRRARFSAGAAGCLRLAG